jgi:hypothetical protein
MPSPVPPGHFLREFGQSDREIINGSNTEPSVPQALALMNGPVTTQLLDRRSVLMQNLERAETPQRKVEVIFLSMFNRKPTPSELRVALEEVKADEREGFASIIWALANTREFLFVQ